MKPRPSLEQLQARAIAASSAPEPAWCLECGAPLALDPTLCAAVCFRIVDGKIRGCGRSSTVLPSGVRVTEVRRG